MGNSTATMPDSNRHISNPAYTIRSGTEHDRDWVRHELVRNWGDVAISSLGVWHQADVLPSLIAWSDSQRVGLATFMAQFAGGACEVITLSSTLENAGVGAILLEACVAAARSAGCHRVFLTTTNDNLRAIGFYQKRGWRMVAVHRGAMDHARVSKPTIPLIGMNNIPLHDEIEFEFLLT